MTRNHQPQSVSTQWIPVPCIMARWPRGKSVTEIFYVPLPESWDQSTRRDHFFEAREACEALNSRPDALSVASPTGSSATESIQSLTFQVSLAPPSAASYFTVPPSVSYPEGDLTFTVKNASFHAILLVVLRDNGGTDYAGEDATPPQRYAISASPPVDSGGASVTLQPLLIEAVQQSGYSAEIRVPGFVAVDRQPGITSTYSWNVEAFPLSAGMNASLSLRSSYFSTQPIIFPNGELRLGVIPGEIAALPPAHTK
jgi:hypothetical protein